MKAQSKTMAHMPVGDYILLLNSALSAAADPVKAAGAKKYMKDQSGFYGVSSPRRKEILRGFLAENGLPQFADIEDFAKGCWQIPYREMQYCAMEILFRMRKKLTPSHISLLELLIQNKGWWDTVDFISPSLAGGIFQAYPHIVDEVTQRWQNHENMWMRRSAILHQLKFKEKTNQERLFRICSNLAHEQEFFIRKAIGWALREYAKTNEASVRAFVAATRLSGLSRREAMKHLL